MNSNPSVVQEVNQEDIYQLMLTLDRQFMAGMAYYSGIRKLGAGIIRVGPGVPSLQWGNYFQAEANRAGCSTFFYFEADSMGR
ncbi:MAG: hypothetical protein WDM78_18055 [Puia sp.]